MSWYVANVLIYFRLKRGQQSRYFVYENLHLVEAGSFEEARAKAEKLGRETAGDDSGTLRADDEPAERVFLGIRKVMLCEDPSERPRDGVELTYNELEVESWEALQGYLLDGGVFVCVSAGCVCGSAGGVVRGVVAPPGGTRGVPGMLVQSDGERERRVSGMWGGGWAGCR